MGLEYDNSAFYYFMISMLSLYLIPGWFYSGKYILSAFIGNSQTSRSTLEKKKEEKMKVNQQGLDKLKTPGFLANLASLMAFSLLFIYLVFQVRGDSAIASFDPYQILSIDRGATDKQIKKAYKLKALEWHPDKNKGEKKAPAEKMFMMVAKAYEALTDDEARANWEKFGNPDGKQSFEMSIGLPTFLMEKDNHNAILVCYLILMVVVIPSVVWAYYRQSQMYGEGNIMYKTYQTYANLLLRPERPAVAKLKTLPELFVTAAEFEGLLATTPEDQVPLQTMFALFNGMAAKRSGSGGDKGNAKKDKGGDKSDKGGGGADAEFMCKPSKWLETARSNSPASYWRVVKGNLILHHHLGRQQLAEVAKAEGPMGAPLPLPDAWNKALDSILLQSKGILDAILAIVSEGKRYESCLEVMHFSQCLTQGLWPGRGGLKESHAPYYQLPHVTSETVSLMAGKKGNFDLKEYLRSGFVTFCEESRKAEPHLTDEELRTMWDNMGPLDVAKLELDPAYEKRGTSGLSDAHRADVDAVLLVLPDVQVDVRHFVHDEDFACEKDTVTLEVKLTRHHMKGSKGKAPPVHAPFFPSAKREEEWWVVLKADDPRFSPWEFVMEKITEQDREVTKEIKFPAPARAGKYKYTVHVISDSYVGLDHEINFDLKVESAAELPEIEDAYKDEDLSTETALEASFGAQNVDSDVSDSDDDGDDDKDSEGKPKAAAAAGAGAGASPKKGSDGLTEAQRKKKEKRLQGKGGGKREGGDEDAVIVEAADADSTTTDEELD
eukprot:CAMPEP_0171605078 /NCGR_PEP_ID=MMETSP0990-20121206/6990_1 /TAXON_ID=483369 /ORGANISM="non described non described, Strain CCMP2098" /LENGTH=777 /DNA_ID=CAMNT_0012167729 /DNA_START=61 /DNA_END=2394 /DNA_ORIENTATION=+